MILFPVSRDYFLPFLICSFIAGVVLGALYEIFRIRRIAFKNSTQRAVKAADTVLTAFEDAVFCVFAAVCMILIAYKLNYGIPRWYSYASAVLGVFLWRRTAGRLIIKASEKIISFIRAVIGFIKKKVIMPPIRKIKTVFGRAKIRIDNNRARAYTKRYQSDILDSIFRKKLTPERSTEK